jgi:hypothetical protein
MVKRKRTKGQTTIYKLIQKFERLGNTNPTENQGLGRGIRWSGRISILRNEHLNLLVSESNSRIFIKKYLNKYFKMTRSKFLMVLGPENRCSFSGTRCVTLVKNPVVNHE